MRGQEFTRVYIAGPYTKGDVAHNVHNAIYYADRLYGHYIIPYVPHLSHFWHMQHPRPYTDWLALDMAWLQVCDAVLRFPGESEGADREVAWALEHGTPVFYTIDDLTTWFYTETLS